MRKKTDEEFGTLVTREMKAMLQDTTLTKEERFDILYGVMFNIDTNERLLISMINSFKAGYEKINKDRIDWINKQRYSKAKYGREHRAGVANIDGNGAALISMDIKRTHKADISSKTKQNKASNIPLNPPSGVEGSIPKAISVDDLMGGQGKTEHSSAIGTERECGGGQGTGRHTEGTAQEGSDAGTEPDEVEELKVAAGDIADEIETTDAWGRMRVNRGKLMKCLIATLKKNGGAAGKEELVSKLIAGLKAWTVTWQSEEWRYAPARITDWIYDGKYLETPRKPKREEAAVGAGCGECGVEIV